MTANKPEDENFKTLIRMGLDNAASWLADILAPRLCAVCGRRLTTSEDIMCLECLSRMPARPDSTALAGRLATMVSNGIAPPGFAAAWFDYDPSSPYATLIRDAKYGDRPRQARRLGHIFGKLLASESAYPSQIVQFRDIDVLLPVPLHWQRRLKRGFNQSHEIARGLAEAGGMAIGDNLKACRAHTSQTHKGGEERRVNIVGTMAVPNPSELDGLNIAIVDDIVTTGSTIAEAVHAISCSGARPASIGLIALGVTARQ